MSEVVDVFKTQTKKKELFDALLSVDDRIVNFLKLHLPGYSSDDRVAVIDDCWKTVFDEWDDDNEDENEIRMWSVEDCIGEIIRLTKVLSDEVVSDIAKQTNGEINELETLLYKYIKQ